MRNKERIYRQLQILMGKLATIRSLKGRMTFNEVDQTIDGCNEIIKEIESLIEQENPYT